MTKALKPRTPEEALRKMAWKFFGDACVLEQELDMYTYIGHREAALEEIQAIKTCAERLLFELRLHGGEKRARV